MLVVDLGLCSVLQKACSLVFSLAISLSFQNNKASYTSMDNSH